MGTEMILQQKFWDEAKQDWVPYNPKTVAQGVITQDGSNVQVKLDAILTQISNAVSAAIADLKGGVSADGDTLAKLHSDLAAIKAILQSDDLTLDTVQEIIDVVKANKDVLAALGANKVNFTDIVNDLLTASTVENKVLDARQGKVLKDLIDGLAGQLTTLQQESATYATKTELETAKTTITAQVLDGLSAIAMPVISDIPPQNPIDGQLWFTCVGTIEV